MGWQLKARRGLEGLQALSLGLALLAAAPGQAKEADWRDIVIRWTADGIPHIRAGNWRDLGYGYGYVQAQDALCTLAEAFVTFAGRRSYFFGAEGRPQLDSSFGRPRNIELDLFFRAFANASVISEYRRQQPKELNDLIDGFAAGYNRYLRKAREQAEPACAQAAWVRKITAADIFRRMMALNLAAGYTKFIPEIVNASPQAASAAKLNKPAASLHQRLATAVGEQPGLGSNVMAFGRQATGEEAGAVLLGNPHWYWSGPDRFYQAHLTIPGRLNVAGVSLLGIPIIVIGFNDQVAWSHTVSEARRFGLFELALDAADRTAYRYGKELKSMQPVPVTVPVRRPNGEATTVSRTLYRTRFGPIVDFSAHDSVLGWGDGRAVAIRDVNANNFRIFRTFFYWNQARSLDEFVAIQRREAAIPWLNTVAIGRGDGRIWYGDIGAVPNVPDSLREDCTTEVGQLFAQLDARVPFLDGSRTECDWQADEGAGQPGAMPAENQPGLFRKDYVANMNDSYWLSSPRQPLEGYPLILGGERKALSLRGRLGHHMAQALLAEAPLATSKLSLRLRRQVLDARVHSAELFKAQVLAHLCPREVLEIEQDPLTAQPLVSSQQVDLTPACQVLEKWNNKGNAQDRGAHLWDAFWTRLEQIPLSELFRIPFAADRPLDTPKELNVADPRIAQAFGAAILAVSESGFALDAPRGAYLYAGTGRSQVPLYGGCHDMGYFTIACGEEDEYKIDDGFFGNSYLQVVTFSAEGIEAYTLLAHGQNEAALDDGGGNDALRRYAEKRWLRFSFQEREIRQDPQLKRKVLRP